MEEKKETKKQAPQEKLSYEQLNNIAHQLSEQNKQLYMKLQEANIDNIRYRLDCLFKVLAMPESFNKEFVNKCSKEVEDIMTIPEETKEEK